MRRCTGGLLLLLLGWTVPVQAQGNKDIVDLLPAGTLACLEVRQPERLSREVMALIKGSAVDDMPRVMARFRASLQGEGRFWMTEEVGIVGLMFSPEMIAEAGRIGGGAVALTGFSKDGTPEVVGLIQTGDCNFVGLFARSFTLLSQAQIVAEVEGVALYREKRQIFRKKGDEAPPEEVERGPVVAQLPGLVILASSTDAVKDVIRRAKGKVADPSLANVAAYRNAAALRDRPGLFGYANVDALAAQLDEIFKKPGNFDKADWLAFKAALNPAALRGVTASLSLDRGALELRGQLQLDPRQKSPVLELLGDQGVKVEWLQAAPKDAALALTVNLGDPKFLERLLALLDGMARAYGVEAEEVPSKKLGELEEKLNLKLGKDVLAKISGVSLILAPRGQKGLGPLRAVLAVQATDAEAARFLEEKALPRLVELPTRMPPLLGRRGNLVVLGLDQSLDKDGVAAALLAAGKKDGLLAQEKVAAALKDVDKPVVLGVGALGTLVLKGVQEMGLIRERRFEVPPPVPGQEKPAKPKEDAPPAMPDKVVEAYRKAITDLPPLVLTVQRKPEQLLLTVRQPALRPAAPRIIDLWVEMVLSQLREQMQPRVFPGKKVGQVAPGQALPAEKAREATAAEREAQAAREAAIRALKEQERTIEELRRNEELRRQVEVERRKQEEQRRQAEEQRRKQERKP